MNKKYIQTCYLFSNIDRFDELKHNVGSTDIKSLNMTSFTRSNLDASINQNSIIKCNISSNFNIMKNIYN